MAGQPGSDRHAARGARRLPANFKINMKKGLRNPISVYEGPARPRWTLQDAGEAARPTGGSGAAGWHRLCMRLRRAGDGRGLPGASHRALSRAGPGLAWRPGGSSGPGCSTAPVPRSWLVTGPRADGVPDRNGGFMEQQRSSCPGVSRAVRRVRPGRCAGRPPDRFGGQPERPAHLPPLAATGPQVSGGIYLAAATRTDD